MRASRLILIAAGAWIVALAANSGLARESESEPDGIARAAVRKMREKRTQDESFMSGSYYLTDDAGNNAGFLDATQDSTDLLVTRAGDNVPIGLLEATADGAALVIADKNGRDRIRIGVDQFNRSYLEMYDSLGRRRLRKMFW